MAINIEWQVKPPSKVWRKSESASVKQWILSLDKIDKACYDYKRENGERLVVSYSDKRAKKNPYNRDRGIVPG